jgi:hypothetical protein
VAVIPMNRVSSSEASVAFRRGDGKIVAEYLRQLSQASLAPSSGVSNAIAERERRGQAAVLAALAEALDPESQSGHQQLVFRRKRPNGRPPDEDKSERDRKIVDAVLKVKSDKFDVADALRAQGKKIPRRMVSNLTDDFKQVAEQRGVSFHTVKTAWNSSAIGTRLKKRSKGKKPS